jgi:hypothetical protein
MDKKFFIRRNVNFAKKIADKLQLSLDGLTVLTECANGPYAYTSIVAALSGAEVIAYGKDTRFGTFETTKREIEEIINLTHPELAHQIKFVNSNENLDLNNIDILTNSGMLRPITNETISQLKSTCVIPLMWETWEFRSTDLDLKACQERGIPVIGTNEYFPLTDMTLTIGLFGVKILFDMKIPVGNCNVVLIGGNIPARHIAQLYDGMGLNFTWFSPTGKERQNNCFPYSQLSKVKELKNIDAFVCAEHSDPFLIAGADGGISFKEIFEAHPFSTWGHIVGNIDESELRTSGLSFFPEAIMPFGHQTYGTENIGSEPVIQLNACGLKVGELAAKARLNGASVEETIKKAVTYGIGQDFEGGFFNFIPKK